MSKLTVTIPDDLHQKIREELERQGITTSQFIEQAVTTFFEKPKGVSNMATRTLAFQVSEELLQRIKTFLARYEQIYHRKLSQKEFLVHKRQEKQLLHRRNKKPPAHRYCANLFSALLLFHSRESSHTVCHPHQLETYGLIEFDQTKMPPCIESYTAHTLSVFDLLLDKHL